MKGTIARRSKAFFRRRRGEGKRIRENRNNKFEEQKAKKEKRENDAKRECYVYIKTIPIDWEIVIRTLCAPCAVLRGS